MFEWSDKRRFSPEALEPVFCEIEAIGYEMSLRRNRDKDLDEHGRYWLRNFKVWEYPTVLEWLGCLQKSLGKQHLKVMDLGCHISPFPEYVARQGHEVWGVDPGGWGGVEACRKLYPHVTYRKTGITKLDEGGFDAIYSCSVVEHIGPKGRVPTLEAVREHLQPEGKQLHVIDFYWPPRSRNRVNFHTLVEALGFPVPDLTLCPGAEQFDWAKVQAQVQWLCPERRAARIAVGDDVAGFGATTEHAV